jgi:hypothetical protein
MSEPAYTDRNVTQYLLGALPAPETERLDELSVTSQEFAEALSAAEKDLVDAYVRGELSGDTLKQFQSHYLNSPRGRNQVEFARAFQEFGAIEVAGGSPSSNILYARPSAFRWSVPVAAVILLAISGFLVFQNLRLHQQNSRIQTERDRLQEREQQLLTELGNQRTAAAQAEEELSRVRDERARLDAELNRTGSARADAVIASLILSPQFRGVQAIQSIRIPSDRGLIAARLELEPNNYSTYAVALIDPLSNRVLWQSARGQATGAAGQQNLNVTFHAELLETQDYLLKVSGVSSAGATEPLGDYPFRVVK